MLPGGLGEIRVIWNTRQFGKIYLGYYMQGIISNILQRMKSTSHSTISAPVDQGKGTLVISARVFNTS